MDVTETRSGQLLDLTADECWALAASQPVGRLAWIGSQGLTLVPVNFVTVSGRVHVRTAAYSALARECDDSEVAFEVDELHAEDRSGWSVLMRGRAHLQFGGSEADRPDVWPAGTRGLAVTIDVHEISGRRVS
jgi:hypothetical protein